MLSVISTGRLRAMRSSADLAGSRRAGGDLGDLAHIVLDSDRLQRVGDARVRGQGGEDAAQTRGREIVSREADRHVVGQAQPLQHHDARDPADAQRGRDGGVGGDLAALQDAARRAPCCADGSTR